MTHEHLIFDSLDGLQRDTDHDYDRCSADSQALVHLRRNYCDRKDCLRCRFGYEYLRDGAGQSSVSLS